METRLSLPVISGLAACTAFFEALVFCQAFSFQAFQHGILPPAGHSLIKVTGGPTLRLLPIAVQQLKLLPRVDTASHFLQPREEK